MIISSFEVRPDKRNKFIMNQRDSMATGNEDQENEYHETPLYGGDVIVSQEVLDQWNSMSLEEQTKFEKKLLWKMDFRIIPWLTLLYLLSFLDRTNIGNAKIQGVCLFSLAVANL